MLLDEESWSSLDVLDRGVLSLVNEGLLDLFEIESRELFDESRMSRIVVLVVVKSVVQSVVGVYSVIVVQSVVVGVDVSIAILFLLSGFAFGCVSEIVPCALSHCKARSRVFKMFGTVTSSYLFTQCCSSEFGWRAVKNVSRANCFCLFSGISARLDMSWTRSLRE